jgi:ABC-type multidrug transport system ATPase subunit
MLKSGNLGLTSQPFNPIEVYWENITIIATIKKRKYRLLPCCKEITTKVILDECTGIIRPGTFTAILGPSG